MDTRVLRKIITKGAHAGLYTAIFCLLAGFLLLIAKTAAYEDINTTIFEAAFYYFGVTCGLLCFPLIMPRMKGGFAKITFYFGITWMCFFLLLGYRSLYNDDLPAHPALWTEFVVFGGMTFSHWYKQTRRKLDDLI